MKHLCGHERDARASGGRPERSQRVFENLQISPILSFRRRRNLRKKLDKDWLFFTELLTKISPPSK